MVEPGLEEAFQRTLDGERLRVSRWADVARIAGVACWLAIAAATGYLGRLPQWRAQVPWVAAYLALGTAIAFATRASPRVRRLSFYSPALLDVPMICALQWVAADLAPDPH